MADIIEEIGDLIPDGDDKGEVRTVSKEFTSADNVSEDSLQTDSNGDLIVTITDLISVEDVVGVLIGGGDEGYLTFDDSAADADPAAANGFASTDDLDDIGSLEDNQAGLEFYDGSGSDLGSSESLPNIKVVARGY